MFRGKIKKMSKEPYVKYGGLGVLFVIALLFGSSILFMVYDVSAYGIISIHEERTNYEMDATSTLNVQDGDFITAWLMDDLTTAGNPEDAPFVTYLFRVGVDSPIASGEEKVIPGTLKSRKWEFSIEAMEKCSYGTYDYYIKYWADLGEGNVVDDNSFTFYITNGDVPVYEDAEITEAPVDVGFDVGESSAYVEWKFSYNGSSVATVTLDGAEVDSKSYEGSPIERIFIYFVDTSVAGIYEIVFTVTPDDNANPEVDDTVLVTIAGDDGTTTTTTTDTTTTTTTTTPPGEEELDWTLIVIVVGVGILVGFVMMRKKSVPVSTQGRGY